MATSLQSLIDTIKEQIVQQSPFTFSSSLVTTLRKRLPNVTDDKLEMLSTLGQALDFSRLTNEELVLLSNINFNHLEYNETAYPIDTPFSFDNPAFDVGGVIVSEDFSKSDLSKAFKRALATNKSLSQSFILNYITNLG